jgi:thiol:disulfide interchange protein DsbG
MTSLRLAALFAAAALLAACSKEEAPATTPTAAAAAPATASAPAAQAAQGPTIEEIQSQAQGFTFGQAMSARTVYVFFDAQCPHCGALWYAAQPLKAQAKFVWIPVRLLKDESATQGAAILASKDPVKAMDDHEASMMDHKGGIKPEGDISAQQAAVKKNTELFNKYAFSSVPTLVIKNSQTGAVVTHEGALQTPDLATFVGASAPPAK